MPRIFGRNTGLMWNGTDHYMSGYDDAQTKAIYEALWNND